MLADHDKANFSTLLKAASDDNLALLDVRRRSDGKSVAAIVAVGWDNDTQEHVFTPLATMIEGDPYKLFDPPKSDEDGYHEEEHEIWGKVQQQRTGGARRVRVGR